MSLMRSSDEKMRGCANGKKDKNFDLVPIVASIQTGYFLLRYFIFQFFLSKEDGGLSIELPNLQLAKA